MGCCTWGSPAFNGSSFILQKIASWSIVCPAVHSPLCWWVFRHTEYSGSMKFARISFWLLICSSCPVLCVLYAGMISHQVLRGEKINHELVIDVCVCTRGSWFTSHPSSVQSSSVTAQGPGRVPSSFITTQSSCSPCDQNSKGSS